MKYVISICITITFFALFACGGGGGGSSPTNSDPNNTHPRLYLNATNMARMVSLANSSDARWTSMLAAVNSSTAYFLPSERLVSNALAYRIKLAKGDSDALTYANKAIDFIFKGLPSEGVAPIVVTGTVTAIDNNKIVDSSQNWTSLNLSVQHLYFLCPDVTQDKYWYMNRDYGSDSSYPAYTATAFYVHPDPNLPLGSGHTGAQLRSANMTTVASVGDTYVLVSAWDDSLKSTAHGMAIAYDWLYDVLTPLQRNQIRAYLRIAGTEASKMTVGMNMYSWTNYTTDGLRDIASIAYALYGDDPAGATLLSYVRNKYESEIQPSLNWIVDGGNWPEGGAYGGASVFGWLQFMRMVKDVEGIDYFTASAAQLKARLDYTLLIHYPHTLTGYEQNGSIKYKPSIIYSDGARNQSLTYDSYRLSAFIIMKEFPDSREAKTAMTFFSSGGLSRVEARFMLCWELLFYNSSQATLPITNTPAESASLNGGVIQMRSSWSDANPTMALFKSSSHTHYHGHLDANSFQIYKYADLAPDTGSYSGSGGSPGSRYYARTVAHNAMLFYDPTEHSWQNVQADQSTDLPNDGGQREVRLYNADGSVNTSKEGSWQTSGITTGYAPLSGNEDVYQHGKITAYGAGTNYVYTAGDASSAYDGNTHKVTRAIRKFLYLRPDIFVVHDVYNLKNTSIEPNFVLHSVDGMTVAGTETVIQADGQYNYTGGNKVTVTNGSGKLVMDTVYPSSVAVRKIGGTNRHNWVDGASRADGSGAYGKWRAEVRPSTISTTGQMLNVLQTTSSSGTTLSTTAIEGTNGRGVLVGGTTVAMFSNAQSGTVSSMSYSATTTGTSSHTIVDLTPNAPYDVVVNGSVSSIMASSAGVITFSDSASGTRSYSVVQTGAPADTILPTITVFMLPASITGVTVPISAFTATDNIGVAGYCVTTTNSSSGCSWTGTAPTSVTFASAGSQTAYGWARDAAGNVSASMSDTVVITIPPVSTLRIKEYYK